MDDVPGRGRDLRRAVVVMVAVPKPTAEAMEFFEPFSDFIERILRKQLNYLIISQSNLESQRYGPAYGGIGGGGGTVQVPPTRDGDPI